MQLPGRLRATTVGDLLGTLHRAGATGTLELSEPRGRLHRIHLLAGAVSSVELDGATASLAEMLRRAELVDEETLRRSLLRAMASRRLHGEVLVRDFHLSATIIDAALRRQILHRLEVLEQLADALIHFRVALRPPRGALTDAPLTPREFLGGRRRARDRHVQDAPAAGPYRGHRDGPPAARVDPVRAGAWRLLGVDQDADPLEIKRAYRRLARDLHPDLHPGVSDAERRSLEIRFAAVTAAYQSLVA